VSARRLGGRAIRLRKERMKCLAPLVLAGLLGGANLSTTQPTVDARGITSKVRIEEVVSGHPVELNGQFKLRATEATFAPGGQRGVHHHVGPGRRDVLSGQVTFTQGGQLTISRAGDDFYESGSIVHTARNDTTSPLRILFVEIPADWSGPTVIPPRS
jgi:quercetin dioxygenase-like cupin family protein